MPKTAECADCAETHTIALFAPAQTPGVAKQPAWAVRGAFGHEKQPRARWTIQSSFALPHCLQRGRRSHTRRDKVLCNVARRGNFQGGQWGGQPSLLRILKIFIFISLETHCPPYCPPSEILASVKPRVALLEDWVWELIPCAYFWMACHFDKAWFCCRRSLRPWRALRFFVLWFGDHPWY